MLTRVCGRQVTKVGWKTRKRQSACVPDWAWIVLRMLLDFSSCGSRSSSGGGDGSRRLSEEVRSKRGFRLGTSGPCSRSWPGVEQYKAVQSARGCRMGWGLFHPYKPSSVERPSSWIYEVLALLLSFLFDLFWFIWRLFYLTTLKFLRSSFPALSGLLEIAGRVRMSVL